MKLARKQQELVISRLGEVAKVCPICGGKNLIISDTVFEIREFNGGNLIIGGKESTIYPLVATVCGNCGNTNFFNAILLGIISRDQKEAIPEEAGEKVSTDNK